MHGQSYQIGEGVTPDRAKARALYEKSCAIDPDFSACDYANELSRTLE
ncbi:SEL1-like repeat protein [Mesorhizobium sp. LHD-90]|nr:SEL1-like repeat protein [Mesorhizobium sp. LHD-90]MDQ6433549.1 SEL1-like repeat protein [Mesorhizobium sp. LHD-90]